MTKKSKCHSSENISRFVDKELDHDFYNEVAQHLDHCPDCRKISEAYKTLSDVFTDHAHTQISKIDPGILKQKLVSPLEHIEKKSMGNFFGIFSKNIYLKLASITAILMISLYTLQGYYPKGPSAIVKSVDTDFASVMIIETQKEKHTIIWFSET